MAKTRKKSKTFRILCLAGSILLFTMAIFHGSGFSYVQDTINESNSEGFLKEIVPILFAHPSIHLIGLAAFGILTLFLDNEMKKILIVLSSLVFIDALLAFYLGGTIPGILLSLAALCFIIAGFILNRNKPDTNLSTDRSADVRVLL